MIHGNAVQYYVVEHIAVLSESNGVTKELNRISYNGAPPKLDLRAWKPDGSGKRMLKGVTLTNEEARALREVLNQVDL